MEKPLLSMAKSAAFAGRESNKTAMVMMMKIAAAFGAAEHPAPERASAATLAARPVENGVLRVITSCSKSLFRQSDDQPPLRSAFPSAHVRSRQSHRFRR